MARSTHRSPKFKTVAQAMAALKRTDQSVADAVGCDRSWITKVRRGEKLASLRLPIKIARELRVPVESLCDIDAA